MRQPYGSKWSVTHREAYKIWLARDAEPAPPPAFGMRALYVTEDAARSILIDEVWQLAAECLTRRQLAVFSMRYRQGMTWDEIGAALDVSRERVRQIELECRDLVYRRVVSFEERNSGKDCHAIVPL